MKSTPTIPPRRRPDLVIQPSGPDDGSAVVKDPVTRAYYQMGRHEIFLLEQLDGTTNADTICQQFQQRFHEPLSPEDLNDFVEMARDQDLLDSEKAAKARGATVRKQLRNILYLRRSLFDPDRLLNWLEPRTRFLFSTAFLLISLTAIAWAGATFFTHREEFIRYIPRSWEAVLFFWLTVGLATAAHELAHGLMCKHYGGEVHEIGVLLMFMMPCFYCDVSDAWLFREKSKRLWVTAAGTYCDLCVWALGVFLWRLTLPQTLIGAFAAVVVSVCGVRVFLNAIPLLKLDGYYFASDLLEIPNMRRRSLDKVADHARWLLWGASTPPSEPRGRMLLIIGLATWSFSLFFLVMMLLSISHLFLGRWGLWGILGVAFMAWFTIPNLFVDFSKGEIMNMFRVRHRRVAIWGAALVVVAAVLVFVPMEEKAAGPFRVRPSSRAEIRAPVSGFLLTVYREEGQDVETGTPIVLLDVPDLASKISEKQAEINEARAKLTLVEIGPRKEEIDEQRQKVARAREWRNLAEQDLDRKRQALKDEVARLSEMTRQYTVERENARENLALSQKLFERKALAQDQLRDWDRKFNVADALVKQAEAQHRERLTVGLQEQNAELARREKESADAKSILALLEIGTRPEEIAAQRAHLSRLEESLAYLRIVSAKVRVQSSIAGVVTTPHLKEKIGGFFKEGDLICEVENINDLEVEIPLPEQEVGHVCVGLDVNLKARALPFESLSAKVHRIAPTAAKTEKPELATTGQNTLTVYCRLSSPHKTLHPGMTGYARINCGQHSMGYVLLARTLRYLRTEVWW